jgi:ABC-type transport system substrate-binding protein
MPQVKSKGCDRMKLRSATFLLLIVFLVNSIAGCSGNTSERLKDKSFSLYAGNISDSLPSTYMPWLSNQGISTTISSSIYNTLFSYDEETGEYTPGLGEKWEYVVPPEYVPENQDYVEVKITLFKNATWSDETPVTSKDVYFTFDLAADYGRTNHAGALAWVGDLLHTYSRGSDGKYTLTRQGVFYKDNPGPYKFGEDEANVVYFRVKKVLGAITPLFTTVLILPEHKWNVISAKNQLNTTNPVPHIKKLYDNPVGSGPYTLDACLVSKPFCLFFVFCSSANPGFRFTI